MRRHPDDMPVCRRSEDRLGGHPGRIVVVLSGVSGSGKSTVMATLTGLTGWPSLEGDTVHPRKNIEKMRAGMPLTDEDRWPWLADLGTWMDQQVGMGRNGILTCSALRRVYRDRLRIGRPWVWFAELGLPAERLRARLESRTGHFMAPGLLASQLALREPLAPDEPGVRFDADAPPDEIAARIVTVIDSVRTRTSGGR